MAPTQQVVLGAVAQSASNSHGLFFDLEAVGDTDVVITHFDVVMGWRSGNVMIYAYEREGKDAAGYRDGKESSAWSLVSLPPPGKPGVKPPKHHFAKGRRPPFGGPKELYRIQVKGGGGNTEGVLVKAGQRRGFCIHSPDGFVAFSAAGAPEVTADDGVLTIHRGDWSSMKQVDGNFDWFYSKDPVKNDGRGFTGRVIYNVPASKAPVSGPPPRFKVGDSVRLTKVPWLRREGTVLSEQDSVGKIVQYLESHVAPCKVERGGDTSWYTEAHLERIA
eukprot:TRINITY_DN22791_c0_g1_i1.p1 TRINITY_DN22791_c0_g1~~TRINITY_DN22791_c0_g1_i1.p1  ORF type:complete len:295 (+),score=62.88 TRINITY_DN22791_c0_g1_i1:60-887(+)